MQFLLHHSALSATAGPTNTPPAPPAAPASDHPAPPLPDHDLPLPLQNNLLRYFDPTRGRWLDEDPIGYEGTDENLTRYVH